jgi:hypothetical protein
MREGKDLFRREQLFAHLRICTFVWPLLPIKPPKKTNTEKTPSDGNRSTVAFCKFVFVQADRGFAAGAVFFWGVGRGRFGKKGVTLRGLRISKKKEILHKLTIHTLVLIYLLYQQKTSQK